MQWWLRDVWLQALSMKGELLKFPQFASTERVARRLSAGQAMQNLQVLERAQRLLGSNVQEALTLEVALLNLNL